MSSKLVPWEGPKGPSTDDHGDDYVAAQATCFGIASIVLGLRIFARVKYKGGPHADDYLMIFAYCLAAVSLSIAVKSVQSGYGRHVYYLTIAQYYRQTKWGYISLPFDVTSSFAGRASFAVSLLMIMGTTTARRAILWSVIALQFSTCVLFICIRLFACKPIPRAWDRRVPGTCINIKWASIYVNYIWLSSNICADLVLAVMPALIISQLNVKAKAKAGLVVLMSLGILNTIAAGVNIKVVHESRFITDSSYEAYKLDIWGLVQNYFSIIIGSIVFLRPLFVQNRFFRSSYYRSHFPRSSNNPTEPSAPKSHHPSHPSSRQKTPAADADLEKPPLPGLHDLEHGQYGTSFLRAEGEDTTMDAESDESVKGLSVIEEMSSSVATSPGEEKIGQAL